MALTKPYGQKNYMGEYASDALTLAFIQGNRWDTNGDGTGDPFPGMLYYNTQLNQMKLWNGTSWRPIDIGSDFQESVINFFDPTIALPVGPAVGDRYISTATANGWINNYIYEWDGAVWMETIPTEGTVVEVEALNEFYAFTGAAWVLLPSLLAHNDLLGLQGGAVGEYYHLTQAQNQGIDMLEGAVDPNGVVNGAYGQKYRDTATGTIYVCISNPSGTNWLGLTFAGQQNFYVGKHGDNDNNGLNLAEAFLTFGAAIAAAVALAPTVINQFSIHCFDSGIYTENLTIPSYVTVNSDSAVIVGSHTLADDSALISQEIQAAAGVIITKSAGAGSAIFRCDRMVLTGNAVGMIVTSGHINFNIGEIFIEDGFGVGNVSTEEIRGFVGDIHISGTGTAFLAAGGGEIEVVGNGIYDAGNGTAFCIVAGATGYISAMFNDINCDVNWDIDDGTFYLKAGRLGPAAGGNTETGVVFVNDDYRAMAIDGVLRTIIPNAAGDVVSVLLFDGFVVESAGGISTPDGNLTPGNALNIYDDGVDVLTLTVNADGSVDIQRTAGAATFTVELRLRWR